MVAAVIVTTIWAVCVTGLYVAELSKRIKTENAERMSYKVLEGMAKVSAAQEAWLRSIIDRQLDGTTDELERKQTIIEKLVTPEPMQDTVQQGGFDDPRLDVQPANTADWTDFDPELWGPTTPGVLGNVPPGFPVPDIEEEMGG